MNLQRSNVILRHQRIVTSGKRSKNGRWTEFHLNNTGKIPLRSQIDYHKRVFIPRMINKLHREDWNDEEILVKIYPHTCQWRDTEDITKHYDHRAKSTV